MLLHLARYMAKPINRMQFLRGDFNGEVAFRPPWAVAEQAFSETCDRCDKCIEACFSDVLKRGAGGFPEVNFSKAGCDFCGDCASACPTRAINKTDSNSETPWYQYASVKTSCLSENGVVCRSCGEACDVKAIRFKLVVGGSAMLEMDPAQCNGCGECISVCPVGAIEMKHFEEELATN